MDNSIGRISNRGYTLLYIGAGVSAGWQGHKSPVREDQSGGKKADNR